MDPISFFKRRMAVTIEQKRLLIIGAGRMAQAIMEGLQNKREFILLVANNGNEQRLNFVREKYGVATTDCWQRYVKEMDIILLAMPPEVHESILTQLKEMISGQLVITVAGGITPSYLEAMLPDGTAVVSVLPNTAAKIGKSMTLFSLGQYVGKEHRQWVETLLSGIGQYEQLSEQQMHELTAITGSAPAFIYKVSQALEKITLESGVTSEQARKLVSQMIAGSAAMLLTNTDPQELADQVATPGGSTAAGLEVLDANRLDHLLKEAIEACRQKSRKNALANQKS
jgi:pyrroline-5-carboxylate reductase